MKKHFRCKCGKSYNLDALMELSWYSKSRTFKNVNQMKSRGIRISKTHKKSIADWGGYTYFYKCVSCKKYFAPWPKRKD